MSKMKDLVIDEMNDAADIIAMADAVIEAATLLKQKVSEFQKKYGYLPRGSNNASAL